MTEKIATLITTRPDSEIAADLKERAAKLLEPITALMTEAQQHGMLITWDGIAPQPPYFKHQVIGLKVLRQF